MNYIKQLQQDVDALHKQLVDVNLVVEDFERYLLENPKFHGFDYRDGTPNDYIRIHEVISFAGRISDAARL